MTGTATSGLVSVSPAAAYGVHSEVGVLRKVLVCAPGLAHQRLTRPTATTYCSTTCCGCSTLVATT